MIEKETKYTSFGLKVIALLDHYNQNRRPENALNASRLAGIIGVTKDNFSKWLHRDREPSLSAVLKLCRHFGISPVYFDPEDKRTPADIYRAQQVSEITNIVIKEGITEKEIAMFRRLIIGWSNTKWLDQAPGLPALSLSSVEPVSSS